VVEVSLDKGEIVSGARREPILELELELKRGSPEALFDLAQDLARVAPLRLSYESKGERGYRLAGHDGATASKAEPARVTPGLATAEAFRAIARSCLAQISTNAELFIRRRNPEALHQLRVGLRRLRAAVSVFKDVLADAQSQRLKAEAKWLSGELNAARDLDVLLQDTLRPAEQAGDDGAGLEGLGKWLSLSQARAYDQAVAAVEGDRFCQLTLDLAAWIETGAWAGADAHAALLEHPIEAFAAPRLSALRRKVRKAGRHLAELDPARRHELRIQAKKLRYATEFFGEAFEGKAARRRRSFLSSLKGFQDALGGLNDIAVAERVAGEAVRQAGARLAFQAGVLAGARRQDEPALRRKAEACFDAFADAKPFW
jgi:triphosphatase